MKSKVARKVAPKKSSAVVNRRAHFDYVLGEEFVAGIVLTGAETKAARFSHVSLRGAYVVPRRNSAKNSSELFLINAGFTVAAADKKSSVLDTRERKLLLNRREIERLISAKNDGQTIVPTKLLTTGRHVKLVIAVARGKKSYDKRAAIREKDLRRESAKLAKIR